MTGEAKRIAASDISALMDGTLNNIAFAEKYGLELWGKYGDSKKTQKIEQTDSNFNFVVVENTAGGNAYIQAVGIDGGPLGGSQVLAKKQLKIAIE